MASTRYRSLHLLFLLPTANIKKGEHQLYTAAGEPKLQWIAPSGGHTGAIKAHTVEYEQRVLAFFAHNL